MEESLDGRHRRKIDLTRIRSKSADWNQLAQDSVRWWTIMNTIMTIRVP